MECRSSMMISEPREHALLVVKIIVKGQYAIPHVSYLRFCELIKAGMLEVVKQIPIILDLVPV